jgi:hypothetical protein
MDNEPRPILSTSIDNDFLGVTTDQENVVVDVRESSQSRPLLSPSPLPFGVSSRRQDEPLPFIRSAHSHDEPPPPLPSPSPSPSTFNRSVRHHDEPLSFDAAVQRYNRLVRQILAAPSLAAVRKEVSQFCHDLGSSFRDQIDVLLVSLDWEKIQLPRTLREILVKWKKDCFDCCASVAVSFEQVDDAFSRCLGSFIKRFDSQQQAYSND